MNTRQTREKNPDSKEVIRILDDLRSRLAFDQWDVAFRNALFDAVGLLQTTGKDAERLSTTYPKCRTCRHFKRIVGDSYGECTLISEYSNGARILADGYDTLTVENCNYFGCLLHSELETDQQKGEG